MKIDEADVLSFFEVFGAIFPELVKRGEVLIKVLPENRGILLRIAFKDVFLSVKSHDVLNTILYDRKEMKEAIEQWFNVKFQQMRMGVKFLVCAEILVDEIRSKTGVELRLN
jgi:hypothetical protein